MRPALLILMMDFLVASLLLYVTDSGSAHKKMMTIPAQVAMSVEKDSVWGAITEMEKEWDAEADNYYTDLLMADTDEKNKSIRNENDQLKDSIQKHQNDLETAEKEAQTFKRSLADKSDQIESMHSEIVENKKSIEKNKEKISEKEHFINSMQDQFTKQLSDAEKELMEQKQKAAEAESAMSSAEQAANSLLQKKTAELANKHEQLAVKEKELMEQKQKAAEAESDRNSAEQDLYVAKKLSAELENQVSALLAQSKGLFSKANQSRVEIIVNLKSKGTILGHNEKDITTYPINVSVEGEIFAISHASSLGLNWDKISAKLENIKCTIKLTPISSSNVIDAQSLNSSCKIILTKNAGGGTTLSLYKSLAEIRDSAMGNLHIFKHSLKTSDLKVDPGATFNYSQKTIDFNKEITDYASFHKPETGDFVVTGDGYLVGVMKDWKTCMLLTLEDISQGGTKISYSSPESFLSSVSSYKSSCSK